MKDKTDKIVNTIAKHHFGNTPIYNKQTKELMRQIIYFRVHEAYLVSLQTDNSSNIKRGMNLQKS